MGAKVTSILDLLQAHGSFPWVLSIWPHSPGWDNPDPECGGGGGCSWVSLVGFGFCLEYLAEPGIHSKLLI